MLEEKTPLQSKKFIGYMAAEIGWKVVLGILLVMGIHGDTIDGFIGGIALAIVIVAGAIEITYIGGQAALDKYVRIAQIAAGAGQAFEMKDAKTTNKVDSPASEEKKPDIG